MRTGRHTVRDIYCRVCHTTLGWKYVSSRTYSFARLTFILNCLLAGTDGRCQDFAFEHDQKYKEGKYILEREMIAEKPERRDIISGKPRIEEIPIREILARV